MKKKIIIVGVILVLVVIKVVLGFVLNDKNKQQERENVEIVDKDVDETPPVLELNTKKLKIEQNTDINYEHFIAKAKDETDGSLKDKVTYNKLDTTKTGEFTITYKVRDDAGNIATAELTVVIYEGGENCCDYSPTTEWEEPAEEKQFNKDKTPKNKTFYIKDYDNLQEANLKAKEYGDSYGVKYKIETGNDGKDYFKIVFEMNE